MGADTANVVLVGLLVRHRGPLAAGVASGGYAIYPAALNASQSLFLEPWLNLFCLLGAVLLFDGDRIAGLGEPGRPDRHRRRALWAGVCFSFAAAVKIWAGIPALVAWVLCLTARPGRPPRSALSFAGGFAAGILVPCLPFEILAPSGFGRTVFVSELVQATHGRVGANPRVTDVTGIIGLSSVGVNPRIWQGVTAAAVVFLFVVIAWVRARRGGIRATALDWFALVTTIVVTGMLFTPSEWYVHYAAFAGPFLVVLLGLSAARLGTPGRPRRDKPDKPDKPGRDKPAKSRPDQPRTGPRRIRLVTVAAVFAALAVAAMGAADGYAVTTLYPARSLQGERAHPARRLRPHRYGRGDDRDRPVQRPRTRLPGGGRHRGHADRYHARPGFRGRTRGAPGRHPGLAAGVPARRLRLADRQQRLHRRADRLDARAARLLRRSLHAHCPAQFLPRRGERPARRALHQEVLDHRRRAVDVTCL